MSAPAPTLTSLGSQSILGNPGSGFESPPTTLTVAETTLPTTIQFGGHTSFFTTVVAPPSTESSPATASTETRTAWVIGQTTIPQAPQSQTSRSVSFIVAFACGIAFVAIAIVIMALVIIRRDRQGRRKPAPKDEIDPFLVPAEDLSFQFPIHESPTYRNTGTRTTKAEADSTDSIPLVNDVLAVSPPPMTGITLRPNDQLTPSERLVFTRLLEERTLEQHLLQFLRERVDTPRRPTASQTRQTSNISAGLPPRYTSQTSGRLNS